MKLVKTKYYIFIALVGIVALILGGIFDKQVSEALYANGNMQGFGVVISNLCLLPFFIVSFTAALIGLAVLIKDGQRYKTGFRVVFIIVLFAAFGFGIFQEYDKIKDLGEVAGKTGGIIIAIVCVILTIALACLIAYKMYKKYNHDYVLRLVLVFAAIMVVSLLFAVVLKYLWSRPRPRYIFGDVVISSHLAEYRNFWEPQPFQAFKSDIGKEYFKSFPSNHVNSATMVITGLMLYTKLNKKWDSDTTRLLLLIAGVLLAILTGFNRITCGMHFLSDVAFGFILTFSVMYFGFLVCDKLNKRYHLIKEPQEE